MKEKKYVAALFCKIADKLSYEWGRKVTDIIGEYPLSNLIVDKVANSIQFIEDKD